MDNKPAFTKLSALVNDQFTIEAAHGYTFKLWDNDNKRMLTSDTYEQGYRKIYSVDTDKGKLDLGPGQLGNLLEAVYRNGEANLNGKTFAVKSNGKTGIDIRYFFNPVTSNSYAPKKQEPLPQFPEGEPINDDDIPF